MMLRPQRVLFPLSSNAATTFTRRSFFNLADTIRNASIKRYNERKILNFTQQQVYEVVANVDDYHHFIPFCNHSRVYSTIPNGQDKHMMQAELGIGFKLFEEKYMSTVTCHQPHKVQAVSSDASLFKELVTTWQFHPHTSNSCRVDFDISFEFASPLHAQASNVFFDQVSQMMMKAFIDRCHQVYASKSPLL
ncbi:hypothetical protein BCR42DRAFT_357196 [Absidia repens]|uniref:Coenzyme Q-binding protein COQ10 START domain-containing protein n=1 Tax=Absidia repens TaxID=90262 RepID=A0A1X2I971_9FUNG|nr:hypothetical protein BCR42DRAFT_357196 [Absidia repens]